MNIFFRELKSNLKSLLIWGVIIILLIMIALAKFSAFAGNPETLAMLDAVPTAVLDALELRTFNLTTLSGFFGVMFLYFSLMGAVAAAMWGSTIISKEERDKTVEFSLVLPVSRGKVVTAKALAALVNCLLFVGITWVASVIAVQSYQPDADFYAFLRLEMIAMLLIEMIFLSIGLLLGCSMRHYKRSGSTAVAIILSAYFLSIMTEFKQELDFIKYITPFKYFDAARMLADHQIGSLYIGISVGIILLCLTFAYWIYQRRDLYI